MNPNSERPTAHRKGRVRPPDVEGRPLEATGRRAHVEVPTGYFQLDDDEAELCDEAIADEIMRQLGVAPKD
jgi:hypothetical protein